LENEDQRLRWDFMFGDGTSKRLEGILKEGLVAYLKRKDRKVLASGRVVATKKESDVLGVKAIGTTALGSKPPDSGEEPQ
jgi:hypothetical protein